MPKVSVNMSNDFQNLMGQVKKSNAPASTDADVIRRAVALYAYLHQQIEKYQGATVSITDANGKIIQTIDPLP